MSGIYYIHVKWAPADKTLAANWGRYLICFASRYDADEFYRAIQDVKRAGKLAFPDLVRSSPQFWCHGGDRWDLIHLVQAEGLVDQFRQVISSFIVNDGIGGGRGLDPIPNPVTGPDWVSGGTFFIRNRRQPRLYWFLHTNKHSSHFHASEEGRTKFKIELAKTTRQQRELEVRGQLVLVRDDLVKVSIVAETTTSSAVLRDKMTYLGVATTSSANGTSVRKLAPVRDEHQWTFGQFLCGSVGVIWEPETAIDGVLENTPVLTYVTKEGADEWELC